MMATRAMHRFDTNIAADKLLAAFLRAIARDGWERARFTPKFHPIFGVPCLPRQLTPSEYAYLMGAFAEAGVAVEATWPDFDGEMPADWGGFVFVKALDVGALERALAAIPGGLDEPVMTIRNIEDIAPD